MNATENKNTVQVGDTFIIVRSFGDAPFMAIVDRITPSGQVMLKWHLKDCKEESVRFKSGYGLHYNAIGEGVRSHWSDATAWPFTEELWTEKGDDNTDQ